MKNILLLGNGAREHALAKKLADSHSLSGLYVLASHINPGIKQLAADYQLADINDSDQVAVYARKKNIDLAVIGPEAPLSRGVVDALAAVNIPAFGPDKELAQLETSKSFTRNLMREFDIPGCPYYRVLTEQEEVKQLESLDFDFVVKPDGLTGGKGVKVQGDHFQTKEEGILLVEELVRSGSKVVVEEKLIGQEFSLMSICDGHHLFHLPAVQDHKRVQVGDCGPNTGGMGSYSDSDFSLPFLTFGDISTARSINQAIADALRKEFKRGYKGVLYGGFMVTAQGVRLIEYNARFGDPEAMNVLAVLQTDFVDICTAVIDGNLDELVPEFEPIATVCKYVVPEGYPDRPVKEVKIDISGVDQSKVDVFYAAVDQRQDGLYLTGSRAIALVGKHPNIYEAEKLVEGEIRKIKGPVFHRLDIGTKNLIKKRIKMMEKIKKEGVYEKN